MIGRLFQPRPPAELPRNFDARAQQLRQRSAARAAFLSDHPLNRQQAESLRGDVQ